MTSTGLQDVSSDLSDRRSQDRRRVLKGATLTFNKGYGAFECVVKNLSENGARLAFGDVAAVPSQFDIRIGGETGLRRALVQWRSGSSIGVRIV